MRSPPTADCARALLDGLAEGVVLWDDGGRPLLANRAVASLWGAPPLAGEVAGGAIELAGRQLEVEVRPITEGSVGLMRDVTAQRELERSRRETQRLVSHELKTPLASIAGFGSMLERYGLDRDEQRRVAGLIRGEADRLGRMVVSFLELERLGSGRWPAERRPLDLSALVARRCQSLAASREGAVLRLDAPAAATILGDPELVERLVDNLVGNALKFSPAGVPVEVAVSTGPSGASLTVLDRGPGIPEEALPRLFERFYRVPEARCRGPASASRWCVKSPTGTAPRSTSRARSATAPPSRCSSRPPGKGARAMAPRLLVADDDRALLELMSMTFRKENCRVATASWAAELREHLDQAGFDLVVCDIYLGDATAIDLLAEIRAALPQAPIILVTAQGTVETAAAAAAAGVFDYLAKPFELGHLVERVRAALRAADRPAPEDFPGPESMIVGSRPWIVAVYTAVARVARLPLPVLITGESGTGKELVARALHRRRAAGRAVRRRQLRRHPRALLESELFGHERGAFTGADRDRAGAIASASGGTVFLDEIGELPRQLQVKLLRFLEDSEIRPVGADAPLRSTLASSPRPTANCAARRRGRIPRGPLLPAGRLHHRAAPLARAAERHPAAGRALPPPHAHAARPHRFRSRLRGTLEVLARHRWPGNVRELENAIQRAAVDLGSLGDATAVARLLPAAATDEATLGPAIGDDLTLEELERLHIAAVLARAGGNRTRAAQILGIERKSLYRKTRRLGIPLDPQAGDE